MTDYPKSEFPDLRLHNHFRGKVAHGHYEPKDDPESESFARSIFAVEALCLLLTCFDMPMTKDGLDRIKHNPLVEHYRLFSLN